MTHGSLIFRMVFENGPLKHPIFERLNNYQIVHWQRSLIFNASMMPGGK
jgi:hypothetical protein